VNTTLLIDALMRKTTVLLATLATATGQRTPLARVANQVFTDLVAELKTQGLGSKVIADMVGMALRTYHYRMARLAESATGDLVYSLRDGQTVVAPLLAASRTPVSEHTVLRISLEDATALEISGPHPTADGRRLDQLAIGEVLDGRRIAAIERIPYRHAFTYDVLPASETAAYLAAGVWLGSTLLP
jgi:hypothetical protein